MIDVVEQKITSNWIGWKYKNTTFLFISLIIFFLFAESFPVKYAVNLIGNFGYLGAFITGVFFVSIFTVAPAGVVLFFLADNLNPLLVAIFAGAGAVLGDYLIFRFLRDRVFEEISPLLFKDKKNSIVRLFKTPYFAWLLPVIGAFVIASPLPDEVGIGLLGASKLKNWQFMALTFILNSLGILLVIVTAKSF